MSSYRSRQPIGARPTEHPESDDRESNFNAEEGREDAGRRGDHVRDLLLSGAFDVAAQVNFGLIQT